MLNQPTSSPMITRIFGLRCCCCAAAGRIVIVMERNSDAKTSQNCLLGIMMCCPSEGSRPRQSAAEAPGKILPFREGHRSNRVRLGVGQDVAGLQLPKIASL